MGLLKKIGFFSAFILPTLAVVGYYLGGAWNYLTVIFAFIMIPLIDAVVGKDRENIEESQVKLISAEQYYRFITFIWTLVQVGIVVWGAYIVSTATLTRTEWWGLVLSIMTVTGGIGITVAHELGHKNNNLEQWLAKLNLMTVCYMHFFIEHNRGHHVHVATPKDPATSRRNESFYAFWVRSVFGGFISAWQIEKNRLLKKKKAVWSLENQMIGFILLPVLFCAFLTLGGSLLKGSFAWEVPVFFFTQSLFAFTLLELVNYIEHYGIVRKQLDNGRYERVNPLHSWNANHLVSNFFLFQLQRHSDHHANATRRYHVLRHFDESPQLPHGYPMMVLIALVPPLWFALMNRRLEHWEKERGLQLGVQ
ncbi:MAG: alkane 1-monooxygenase [Thermonemataceae bacterium]